MRTLVLLVLLSATAAANDLNVVPGQSIQSAIASASAGDRVLVAPGTYTEQIDFLGLAIEVVGTAGAEATVIDGGGVGPVVRFASGEGAGAKLIGFTVRGGFAAVGAGGIACALGATPLIADCVVRNNSGKFGGGVSGSPSMSRCVIRDNTASLTPGGGIYGAPQLDRCLVVSNSATSADGGGVYLIGGSSTITHSVIAENGAVFANSQGGGIYVDSTASLTLEDSLVVGNFSTGGVFNGRGGGLYAEAPTATATGCTIVGNSVSGSSTLGAGVYGAFELVNSIVRDNLGGPQISSAEAVNYCDVSGGFAGVGNFDADPLFVDSVGGDLHLRAESSCIDAGAPVLLDPDGSRSDVGAYPFQTLYTRSNLEVSTWAAPAWDQISMAVGGTQEMVISAGIANAGGTYLTMGTASGTTPGLPFFADVLPLNPDAYWIFTVSMPSTGPLSNSVGMLNGEGLSTVGFQLAPALDSALAGVTVHHAAAVGDAMAFTLALVTNALELTLVP